MRTGFVRGPPPLGAKTIVVHGGAVELAATACRGGRGVRYAPPPPLARRAPFALAGERELVDGAAALDLLVRALHLDRDPVLPPLAGGPGLRVGARSRSSRPPLKRSVPPVAAAEHGHAEQAREIALLRAGEDAARDLARALVRDGDAALGAVALAQPLEREEGLPRVDREARRDGRRARSARSAARAPAARAASARGVSAKVLMTRSSAARGRPGRGRRARRRSRAAGPGARARRARRGGPSPRRTARRSVERDGPRLGRVVRVAPRRERQPPARRRADRSTRWSTTASRSGSWKATTSPRPASAAAIRSSHTTSPARRVGAIESESSTCGVVPEAAARATAMAAATRTARTSPKTAPATGSAPSRGRLDGRMDDAGGPLRAVDLSRRRFRW